MAHKLTVGSVDTMVVLCPAFAIHTAVAEAIVVLPTPPLPPKNKYFVPFVGFTNANILSI
jgi:hypothetical protein